MQDLAELPQGVAPLNTFHEGLNRLLGSGDEFAGLRSDYNLKDSNQPMGLDMGLGLGDLSAWSDRDRQWWHLDRFLFELREFLSDASGPPTAMGKWKVSLKVTPILPRAGDRNLWTNFSKYAYLYSSIIDREREQYAPLSSNPDEMPELQELLWTVDEASEPMFFEWSLDATGLSLDSNPKLHLHSFIGPMVWVWSKGDQAAGEQEKRARWKATFEHSSQPEDQADFQVRFDRPLPSRPQRSPR